LRRILSLLRQQRIRAVPVFRRGLAVAADTDFSDTRILTRKTVEYMLSNQLGPDVRNQMGITSPVLRDYGFGLSVAVRTTSGFVGGAGPSVTSPGRGPTALGGGAIRARSWRWYGW
jgi:hypothetical protein